MKTIRPLIAAAALAGVLIRLPAHPQGHEKEAKPAPAAPAKPDHRQAEWYELFGDAPLPVVWQSAQASLAKITAAVSAKSSDGVADWAETIHLAAHALVDQVQLPDAERKKRLDAALEQAARIADEVLDAAHHHEAEKLAESSRRLHAAMTLGRTRLPREITEAPPQTPRFAKAPKHEDGDHRH